jgi:hypothetical protein
LPRLSDGGPAGVPHISPTIFAQRDARPIAGVLAQIDHGFAKNPDHARNA